jgi:hypothetical protein
MHELALSMPTPRGHCTTGLCAGLFFSEACRQRAAEIGLSDMTSIEVALSAVAAFGRRLKRPGVREALDDACEVPGILLVNLLRLNRVDAELVLMTPSRHLIDDAPAPMVRRIYVYVPKHDRYLDPETLIGRQGALDRIFREQMERIHLQGPSIAGVSRNTCADVCLMVTRPRGSVPPLSAWGPTPPLPPSVRRIKTETIRGP